MLKVCISGMEGQRESGWSNSACSPALAPNSGARATQASTLPAVRGPRCVLLCALMAGKLLSLVPPLLLAAVGAAQCMEMLNSHTVGFLQILTFNKCKAFR